jgi:hypothetical protein
VESVTVCRDKVEVKFKIAVPDGNSDTLCPLKVEHDLMEVKERYKKTG